MFHAHWMGRAILVVALVTLLPTVASAQTAQPAPETEQGLIWQPIGTLRIDGSEGLGEYQLRVPLSVRAVRLVAQDAVTVSAVVVKYESGRVHLEERRIALDPAAHSGPIGLTEGQQNLVKIEVFGQPDTSAARIDIQALAPPLSFEILRSSVPTLKSGDLLSKGTAITIPANGAISFIDRTTIGSAVMRECSRFRSEYSGPIEHCVSEVPPMLTVPGATNGSGGRKRVHFTQCPTVEVAVGDCSLVSILFGTNRTVAQGGTKIVLGPDPSGELKLGRAFVTVPRRGRSVGTVPVPSTFESLLTGTDPKRHFTMPAGAINIFDSDEAFLAAAREELAKVSRTVDGTAQRHAFVFVHGYRVTFENAAFRAAQIAFDLTPDGRPFATAFLYSWPSGGGAADYLYDLDTAVSAVPHLTRFLQLVIDQTDATHVHVIAHSMGNVPLLEALRDLKGKTQRARINQIIVAAPDIDKARFEQIAGAISDFGSGATLYASASDRALLLSRLGRRNTPRAGDVKQPPGPAIAPGIDTIDVSALSTGIFSFGWNHDTYADSREIINDIALQFRDGPSRPDSRNVNFRPEKSGDRQYWRYRD